jgi:MerR family transcriptional regulator, light-induced transcriptional regulator
MNLQEAAGQLGVHYQTIYRWVRQGELAATKRGASYEVSDEEVARFLTERNAPIPPPERLMVRDWSQQRNRFITALHLGDELVAREVLDRLADGNVSILDICEELIAPSMRFIGDEWHAGRVSVAEEHRATSICERMVSRLTVHPRGRPRGTAVVSTPPNDLHGLPSAMAAVVLREDRWKVHHLGANTPVAELIALCRQVDADVAIVSSTMASESLDIATIKHTLAENGIHTMVGGPGSTLRGLIHDARKLRDSKHPE